MNKRILIVLVMLALLVVPVLADDTASSWSVGDIFTFLRVHVLEILELEFYAFLIGCGRII